MRNQATLEVEKTDNGCSQPVFRGNHVDFSAAVAEQDLKPKSFADGIESACSKQATVSVLETHSRFKKAGYALHLGKLQLIE